jgi:hypothetical protein
MQHVKSLKFGIAAFIAALGGITSGSAVAQDVIAVANGVNMWDGQWHYAASIYGWVPWIYPTAQLPAIAGGGTTTPEIQPSDYLDHLKGGVLFSGAIQKGDWGVWTDLVFLNLQANPTHVREIGLPGGDPLLEVTRTLDAGVRAAVWTLAPTYTVMNNDVGTLDVLVGLRYSSLRISLAYEFTAPPLPLMKGGGFWPTADSTDGLVGVKGTFRLSPDGTWYVPYEADIGDGNKNWQYNLWGGVGYHFRWGDVTLACRSLTYNPTDRLVIQKVRMTGPTLGATFRW